MIDAVAHNRADSASDRRTIRVAICDDDLGYRMVLAAMLGQYPDLHVIAECPHGGYAVAQCQEDPPDVLLIDLEMPVVDGYSAIKRIRAHNARIGIVVVSGTAEFDDVRERAINRGANIVLGKTASAEDIVATIRELQPGR